MIIDRLENARRYRDNEIWRQAWEFLEGLAPDAREGRYVLCEDRMYAVVEGYETKPSTSARPEAHRKYTDIQMVLCGAEKIGWWPARGLEVRQPYDAGRDIEFYAQPGEAGATVTLAPGRFAVFFPDDAHMPGLHVNGTAGRVRKVVVKIAL